MDTIKEGLSSSETRDIYIGLARSDLKNANNFLKTTYNQLSSADASIISKIELPINDSNLTDVGEIYSIFYEMDQKMDQNIKGENLAQNFLNSNSELLNSDNIIEISAHLLEYVNDQKDPVIFLLKNNADEDLKLFRKKAPGTTAPKGIKKTLKVIGNVLKSNMTIASNGQNTAKNTGTASTRKPNKNLNR